MTSQTYAMSEIHILLLKGFFFLPLVLCSFTVILLSQLNVNFFLKIKHSHKNIFYNLIPFLYLSVIFPHHLHLFLQGLFLLIFSYWKSLLDIFIPCILTLCFYGRFHTTWWNNLPLVLYLTNSPLYQHLHWWDVCSAPICISLQYCVDF